MRSAAEDLHQETLSVLELWEEDLDLRLVTDVE
jgi:hypothetical protein